MIIVRYGEIALKSPQTRRRLERILAINIESKIDGRHINMERGRLFVDSNSIVDAKKISSVFGVVSTSVASKTTSKLEDILALGVSYAKERLDSEKTFAVRARRKGGHPYKSTDVADKLGREIERETNARVDLINPDVTIYVEVRDKDTYIFDNVIPGVGGLPLGTQGRALALISGGIDSPVAAWRMMKRGVELAALFMDCRPLVDDRTFDRAISTIKILSNWADRPLKTYIAPYGDSLMEFLKYGDHRLGCVLCKRMMYRVGEKLAHRDDFMGLVTGESLGQVASQTIQNIAAIEKGIDVSVFRPLIGLDKNEIVEIAREIGTYEASIQPANCCLGPPTRPETKASIPLVLKAERKLNMESLVSTSLEGLKIMEISHG